MSEYGAFGSQEEDAWSEDEVWSEGAESPEADLVELDDAERGQDGPAVQAAVVGDDVAGDDLAGDGAFGGDGLGRHDDESAPEAPADDHDPLDDIADAATDDPADTPTLPAAFEPTGEPRVDDAIGRLDELADAPTGDHVGVFEDVHRRLHDALSDLGLER